MPIDLVTVPVETLTRFSFDCLRAMGCSEEEATLFSDGLIQSELRCLPGQGQGVRRLPIYLERINKRWTNIGAQMEIIKESPALALVDAHNGLGAVMGQRAMDLAVKKSKSMGIGTVIMRNSTHYGSSGVHVRRAINSGCIGIAMTNAGPEMAPWGGSEGRVGTNPWAMGAPTGGDFPVILDIALTTAGKGMMRWFLREGLKMPSDWALTPDGNETDDPGAAMDGPLLAIGQHKGYGLAMMTDVITGVISGAAFGLTPYASQDRLQVSHTFIALDIEWFMPLQDFLDRMDAFVNEVKSSKTRPGFDAVLVPGEIDHIREMEYRNSGAKLDKVVYEELRDLAETLNIDFPFRD